jgi:DnaJ-class molecular chaperone
MARRRLSSILKELDEISKTLTGRDIPSWTKQAWEELQKARANNQVAEPSPEDPYEVLDLDPNCIPSDIIYRYRQLAKKYHPDGTEPDVEKFKRMQEAYEEICRRRKLR